MLGVAVTAALARETEVKSGFGLLVVGLAGVGVLVAAGLRWARWVPALVVLVAAVVPYEVSFVEKTPFGVVSVAGVVAALLAVIAIAVNVQTGRGPLDVEGGLVLLVGWAGWATLSAATSLYPKVALNDLRQVLFALPFAYLAGRAIGVRQSRALDYVLGALGLVAALAILQELTHFSPVQVVPKGAHFPLQDRGETFRYGLVRVRVGFYHASDLGRVLAVSLPLFLVRAGQLRRALWPKLGGAAVVVALILTLTFADWIAATVGLAVLAVAHPGSRRAVITALVAAGIALAVGGGTAAAQLVQSRVHPTGSSLAEFNLRGALVPASVQYADHHRLLGAGPGTFNLLNLEYPVAGVQTRLVDDNALTTELVETGYPGLVLLVLGLLGLALGWWRQRRNAYFAAALAGLAAWVVGAATVDPLARDAPLLAVFLMLGLATGMGGAHPDGIPSEGTADQRERTTPSSTPATPAAVASQV